MVVRNLGFNSITHLPSNLFAASPNLTFVYVVVTSDSILLCRTLGGNDVISIAYNAFNNTKVDFLFVFSSIIFPF
jgi:hypothetical protein